MMTKEIGDQHLWRVRMFFLHGAMLAAPMALLMAHTIFHVDGLGVCIFRAVFGIDCPGCGITRSTMSLFAGNIIQALHLHPAGPLVVALIVLIETYLVLVLSTKFRGLEWRKEVQTYTGIEILAFVALMIGWIVKMFMN